MYGSLLANVSSDRKIKETIEQFPQHTQAYRSEEHTSELQSLV